MAYQIPPSKLGFSINKFPDDQHFKIVAIDISLVIKALESRSSPALNDSIVNSVESNFDCCQCSMNIFCKILDIIKKILPEREDTDRVSDPMDILYP